MVSSETGLPSDFAPGRRDSRTGLMNVATAKNVRWVAPLGPAVYGTPVVAEGRVLVGSNGSQSDREQLQGDRAVLSCLDENNGELLWELVVPKMLEMKFADWYNVGMTSVPVVENSKVYLISNRAEVLCLDLAGMNNGNDGAYQDEARHSVEEGAEPITLTEKDADILWLTDLVDELGVMPHNACNCSILIDGNFLYVCTGNGVDWKHNRVMNPTAPTLIVLDKRTGKILARDNFNLGPDIIHGQWSSPALGVINGQKLVFQGTGSGWLFAVEALTEEMVRRAIQTGELARLKTVWKFNGHPLAQKQEVVPLEHFHDTKSYHVTANPVFADNRLYVVFSQEMFHNIPDGWLLCLDPGKNPGKDGNSLDITRSGGLLWAYEGISSSASTVAVSEGLLFVADGSGKLHCLNSRTGQLHWHHSLGAPIWGSPLIADGKVYIGTAGRRFFIFEASKEMRVISQITMPDQVLASATAANGRLYIPVFGMLFAIEQ